MSLDLFAPAIHASDLDVAQNAAKDLPAGFSEAFDISWRDLTEWHNANAVSVARARAFDDYRADIQQKTGETLPLLNSSSGELQMLGVGGTSLDDVNAAQAKLKEKYPGLDYLEPLTDDRLEAMARARMAKAHGDAAAFQSRETTWGGTAGTVLGTLGGGLVDPVTIATLPLGGVGEAGVVLRAAEFAAIAGGTEAADAAINFRAHEAAVPGSSKEIPGQIGGAVLFGGALGGAFGALGKWLGAGSKVLPTSVRDEVNAATSEAQFHVSNPFPTAAGEAAARDAHVEAVGSMLRGDIVRAGDNFDAVHVAGYADAAKAETPEALALAGERHLRPETFDELPNVERFDPMPAAGEDTAAYWERRLADASPEERAAIGATDDAAARTAAGESKNAIEGPSGAIGAKPMDADIAQVTARDLSPDEMVKLAADPQTESAVLRNLDRIRVDNPDAEFSVQVKQADGSFQITTRRLEDVLDEIDGVELTGKELLACATGMMAAE